MARTVDRVIGRSITVSRERERLHPPRRRTERGQKSKDFPIIRGKIDSITFWSSVQWGGEGREGEGEDACHEISMAWKEGRRRSESPRKDGAFGTPLLPLCWSRVTWFGLQGWRFFPLHAQTPPPQAKRGRILCEVEERRKVMMASGGGKKR